MFPTINKFIDCLFNASIGIITICFKIAVVLLFVYIAVLGVKVIIAILKSIINNLIDK